MSDHDRVKEQLKILDLITRETGLTMKGPHLSECPFCGHHDCFSVDKPNNPKQLYKCHSCDEGGDIFTFLERLHNLGKGEALRSAAEIARVEISMPREKSAPRAESTPEKVLRHAAQHYEQAAAPENSLVRAWFCGRYKEEVLPGVIGRGHTPATLQKLRVGLATDTLLAFLKEQGIEAKDAVKAGLAKDKDKDGKEIEPKDFYWSGLAVFPVVDHAGTVISFTCKDPRKKYRGLQLKDTKKTWFINHAALGAFHDTIVCEGENDVASILDAGINGVIGTAGQPSTEQITSIRNHFGHQKIYLWFDQDRQENFKTREEQAKGRGGDAHIRKLYKALSGEDVDVRVITHPGEAKDPDEYIQGLFRAGKSASEVKQAVRVLIMNAAKPLRWELLCLETLGSAEDRLAMFKARELPQAINKVLGSAEREILIDQAAKSIGITVRAVEEIVVHSHDLFQHLKETYGSQKDIKNADAYILTERIWQWFNNGAGARFFKTRDGKVYLYYNRKRYEIGRNLDFDTLMMQLTRLAPIDKPGSLVWHYLGTMCNAHGELVDMTSWMHTDRERDTVYLNLNSEHNKIIRIAPGTDPQMIDNGTNEQSVMLSSSSQIQPFEYQPNTGEAEGFRRLGALLMDTTPAELPQRYFLLCWTVSIFLMHYQTDRGLLQVIGGSGLGKSKVAERVSMLLYGETYVGKGTGAAETRVATNNPIVFLDNLENRNLVLGTVDFLLFLANSAHKPKAKAGSDTEVLYQKLNAMGMTTGIEPFPGKYPELINRTWPLILDGRFKMKGYMHDATLGDIKKNRNAMLSAIFKVLSRKVLPNLERRRFWSQYLQSKHAGHNKERNNEHLCTIIVILEALLEYLPIPDVEGGTDKQAIALVDRWISYHEDQAQQAEITSNTLLVLMDGLAKEISIKIRGQHDLQYQNHPEFEDRVLDPQDPDRRFKVKVFADHEYQETFYLSEPYDQLSKEPGLWAERVQRLEFIITSAELHTLLSRYCYKGQGQRNPYENPYALGSRIANDHKVMVMGGWEYVTRSSDSLTFKRIRGKDHWRFSKEIIAIE